ncbi:hypothetical protein D3C87_2057330 [compost metagenome]
MQTIIRFKEFAQHYHSTIRDHLRPGILVPHPVLHRFLLLYKYFILPGGMCQKMAQLPCTQMGSAAVNQVKNIG